MEFNLKSFFEAIFAPQKGEVVTFTHDIPHGSIRDTADWKERRKMIVEWRNKLLDFASDWDIKVNPILIYNATGSPGRDLPSTGIMDGQEVIMNDVILNSTIVISMPEFSATAPLFLLSKKLKNLRVASMPGAQKFMEDTGLSADYTEISKRCKTLAPFFEKAKGAMVEFSTGQKCYFDISNHNPVLKDDGILHPEMAGTELSLHNLPAGEVCITPNENPNSETEGELPVKEDNELAIFIVKHNKIIDVKGTNAFANSMRGKFKNDPGWRNVAECAIGCNDKAKVTGNALEDEKAGFHWAYGRSDHIGGTIGVKDFVSPNNVIHQDIVYSKDSPIVCKKFDFVYPDNSSKTVIIDGKLLV